MNRVLKIIAIIFLLTGFSSCTIDSLSNDPRPVSTVPDGYILTTLDLSVEKSGDIQTRATVTEEGAYDKNQIWALLFYNEGSFPLVQAPVKAIPKDDQFHLMLRATKKPVLLVLVTGLNSTMNEYLGNPGNFTEGGTTYGTVFNKLISDPVTAGGGGVPIGNGSYFHMSTAPIYRANTTSLNSETLNAQFKRNVAKIDVNATTITDRGVFALEGVTLVNAAPTGSVLQPSTIPTTPPASAIRYAEKTTGTNQLLSQIYLYENAGRLSNGTDNPTKLIVRGKYMNGVSSYYRMDIVAKNDADKTYTPHDINRNFCYTLNIKKIENAGYPTFDEALAAEPTNTGTEVIVTDPNTHDIVSNGHYYLGVSNSDFIVRGDDGQLNDLLITTVTTDAPKERTQISITASDGITLHRDTELKLSTTGAPAKSDIVATISSSFSSGSINLRVGNLTQEIIITRGDALLCADNNRDFLSNSKYVEANVASGTEWVRLHSTSAMPDFNSLPVSLINPNGAIWVRCNTTLDMNATRSAEVYAHKANNEGRAKLLLFAKNVRYMSSTLPDVIDITGVDVNGVSRFTATFYEAGGYPFSVGIFAEGSTTPLMEKEVPNQGVTEVVDIDLRGLAVTGSVNLPRMLELKYKVNGNWYETGKKIQQRTFFNVHILSVGGNNLSIDNGSSVDYGTQLGPGMANNYYTNCLGRMLYQHTGSGKPIQNNFKLFHFSYGLDSPENGTIAYTNIGKRLRDNNIDILVCSIDRIQHPGGGPNAQQTQEILNWLDENPYRGLLFITDFVDNAEISKALFNGVSHTALGGLDPFHKLPQSDPYYNHPVYKAITQGSYSTDPSLHAANPIDLRKSEFVNHPAGQNAYGGVPLAATNAAGFIPIFYVTANNTNYVLAAVHPTRNIVMLGDISWFGNAFSHNNGSLDPKPNIGNYPKLVMNMWEWFINNVALGGRPAR